VLERVETAPTEVERSQAARDLVRHGEAAREEIHTALVRKQPEEPEVIAPLLQATMKVRDHRSLPTAIDLLDHPDPLVRGRAGAAVREILGADFGFRANDPPEKRAKVVAMIKADYANAHQRIGEFYESQR